MQDDAKGIAPRLRALQQEDARTLRMLDPQEYDRKFTYDFFVSTFEDILSHGLKHLQSQPPTIRPGPQTRSLTLARKLANNVQPNRAIDVRHMERDQAVEEEDDAYEKDDSYDGMQIAEEDDDDESDNEAEEAEVLAALEKLEKAQRQKVAPAPENTTLDEDASLDEITELEGMAELAVAAPENEGEDDVDLKEGEQEGTSGIFADDDEEDDSEDERADEGDVSMMLPAYTATIGLLNRATGNQAQAEGEPEVDDEEKRALAKLAQDLFVDLTRVRKKGQVQVT